jgi:hypothetical protein
VNHNQSQIQLIKRLPHKLPEGTVCLMNWAYSKMIEGLFLNKP